MAMTTTWMAPAVTKLTGPEPVALIRGNIPVAEEIAAVRENTAAGITSVGR